MRTIIVGKASKGVASSIKTKHSMRHNSAVVGAVLVAQRAPAQKRKKKTLHAQSEQAPVKKTEQHVATGRWDTQSPLSVGHDLS